MKGSARAEPTKERKRSRGARAYDIHLVTFLNCKKELNENVPKTFGGGDEVKKRTTRVRNWTVWSVIKCCNRSLEGLLGEKGDLDRRDQD